MEKRVDLELRGRTPSQVKELNLDNCRSTNIVGLSDEYTNLETLSLNNVGLTSLKGFPTLPNLKKLELSDNRISNGLNFLGGCKKLTYLNIAGNKIQDLDALKPLDVFENLKYLDLYNNEVTSIEDYRNKVFALHPSLKYLDGFDIEDGEAEDSEEEEMNGNNDSDDDNADDGSDVEEEEDDEEDVSLSAVYNENLEEESSASSLYEGGIVEEEEEADEEDEEVDGDHNNKPQDNTEGEQESTRGKKRKHEDEDEN